MNPIQHWRTGAVLVAATLGLTTGVHAADGCKFLLCIAGPWASIAECRPPVLEVFRDMARGRPLPSCSMSGAGNSAANTWASQGTCPRMYWLIDSESGGYAGCRYPGRIQVQVNGQLWSQVYWDFSGNSTAQYSDVAKATMRQGNAVAEDQYEADLRAWNDQIPQCVAKGGTASLDEFGAFEKCVDPWWWGDGGGGG